MSIRWHILVPVLAGLTLIGQAAAGPSVGAPGVQAWQLDFEFQDPQRITVNLPGGKRAIYWYLLYSATNETGREVDFYPSFDLVTDTLKVVEGGNNVHPKAHQAIRDRHASLHPFFTMPTDVTGLLRQGEDNKRTSAVAFEDFDPNASGFTLYVGGLSGETARIPNAQFDPEKPESEENPRFFVLRKTLAIKYAFPGDPRTRQHAEPVRVGTEWVMR